MRWREVIETEKAEKDEKRNLKSKTKYLILDLKSESKSSNQQSVNSEKREPQIAQIAQITEGREQRTDRSEKLSQQIKRMMTVVNGCLLLRENHLVLKTPWNSRLLGVPIEIALWICSGKQDSNPNS